MVKLFYTTYICVDLAHHQIFRAKVGKGGIKGNFDVTLWNPNVLKHYIHFTRTVGVISSICCFAFHSC